MQRVCVQVRNKSSLSATNWHLPLVLAIPGGSDGKDSACNSGDLGSIPELGKAPGEEHGNPLQYSYLENPHGQRSLAGYSPGSCKESDTTERLSTAHSRPIFSHFELLKYQCLICLSINYE